MAYGEVDQLNEGPEDALEGFTEAVLALFADPKPDNVDRYLAASLALDRQLATQRRSEPLAV